MVAAVVFQAVPAQIGCWLEGAGLAPVSTLIIITTHCNSHANHSSEQRRAEGERGRLEGAACWDDVVGGVRNVCTERFQQALIGPFTPTSSLNETG